MSDDLNETIDLGTILEGLIEELQEPLQLEEEDNKDNYSSERSIESMSNPAKSTLDDIFGNLDALSDTVIVSSLVSHKKTDRATMDTKTLHQVKENATKSLLDIEFKVQTGLGTSGVTGSKNPDLETNEMTVIFAENTHVLEK